MLGIRNPALPASLRRTNERTVVSLLMRMGVASRADLAKAAGISQPTSGKIIADLLELGILTEVEPGTNSGDSAPRLGRPGQLIALDKQKPRFIAVELGVHETRMSALPVCLGSEDAWTQQFATPGTAAGLTQALREAAQSFPRTDLWGVLFSVPGIVDEAARDVLFCPNLHWLERASLTEIAESVWQLPVLLVQEIRALALGHLTSSETKGSFLLVDFGVGVGGAIVSNGSLYSSATPLAGEFGHTPVPGNQRRCGCGAIGCLETLVSRDGLLASFAEVTSVAGPSWEMLRDQVRQDGVPAWLCSTLDHTAHVIAGAMNVLGIQRVVVTGLLNGLSGPAWDHLSNAIRNGALWGRFGEVQIERAARRRSAGLVACGLDRLVFPEKAAMGHPTERVLIQEPRNS